MPQTQDPCPSSPRRRPHAKEKQVKGAATCKYLAERAVRALVFRVFDDRVGWCCCEDQDQSVLGFWKMDLVKFQIHYIRNPCT